MQTYKDETTHDHIFNEGSTDPQERQTGEQTSNPYIE